MMQFLRAILALFGKRKPKPPVVVPPPPIIAVACTHGVVSHKSAGDLDDLKALGVKIVRLTYYVRNPDSTHWTWQLPLFDAAGIEPMLVVHDTDSVEHTVATMADLTRRYSNRLWQVGNEWNASGWSRGDFAITGGQYAVLMQRVIAACPAGTRFCGVGLAFNYAQATYLADYLAAGGPTLEAWCIHTYGVPNTPRLTVGQTQAVLKGRMPLWITEYGIEKASMEQAWGPQTDAAFEEEQRKEMIDLLAVAGSLGVSRTYYYCMSGDEKFALVMDDGRHRPAWDVLHAALP
jgi:hypothetical protein